MCEDALCINRAKFINYMMLMIPFNLFCTRRTKKENI